MLLASKRAESDIKLAIADSKEASKRLYPYEDTRGKDKYISCITGIDDAIKYLTRAQEMIQSALTLLRKSREEE